MSYSNDPAPLELTKLFEAVAMRLESSVQEGRVLHGSKNIRNSGSPLEVEFREFLGSRLPAPFSLRHGYMFDPSFKCSPQIDLMITDDERCVPIADGGEGSTYVSHDATYAIAEIKSSDRGIEEHLDQLSKRAACFWEMENRLLKRDRTMGSLLTFLLIADARRSDFSAVRDFVKSRPGDFPHFVISVNTGQILVGTNDDLNEIIGWDALTFAESGPNVWAYQSESATERRGKALMWLYFRIIYHLHKHAPGRGTGIAFWEEAMRSNPMAKVEKIT